VEGLIADAPGAEEMAIEAFDSLEEAATAYAYLVGYLLQHAAHLSGGSVDEVMADLRERWFRPRRN
jgi:hypothetical protein